MKLSEMVSAMEVERPKPKEEAPLVREPVPDDDKYESDDIDFTDFAICIAWLEQAHIWMRLFLDPKFRYSTKFNNESKELEQQIGSFLNKYDTEDIMAAANESTRKATIKLSPDEEADL